MMKRIVIMILMLVVMFSLFGKTAEDYIKSAQAIENIDIFKAIEIMEEASEEFPKNADVLSLYGLMVSKGAGQASMLKAEGMVSKAEKIFTQALKIEPNHKDAILSRGILRVNVPKFFNKLSKGIEDLENIVSRPGLSNDDYLLASYYLGLGHEKKRESEKAVEYYKNIVRYGADSPFYQDSLKRLEQLTNKSAEELIPSKDMEVQADKFIEQEDYLKAYEILTEATKQDSSNIDLYLKYLNVIRVVSQQGYDERTYNDVAFMTDLAFNVAHTLRRIVELMPENEDFRLLKAEVLSQLPFFVKSLEEARDETEWIINNSMLGKNVRSATALKKRIEARIERKTLTDQFVDSEDLSQKEQLIAKMQFDKTEAEEPEGMSTKVTLSLGFGDYIAPQTAVWVEDMKGNYVASIYVSGFSAAIKEKQVHLPTWAKKSVFEDSIVKITGASIDSGKHIFYWNNRDKENRLLTRGDYYVIAEVSHWPHANYSIQKVKLSLGGKSFYQSTKGDLVISELKVEY